MKCCKDPENKDCIVFKLLLGIEIVSLFLVCLGVVPRELILVSSALVLFYLVVSPVEDGLMFFIASIPIFVALPILEGFDSLSAGRLFVLILFLKWLWQKKTLILPKLKTLSFREIFKSHRFELFSLALLMIMGVSLINAVDLGSGIKRFIYLINLVVVFIMIKDVIKDREYFKRTIKAILISLGIVCLIGLVQLISVYFFTIGGFWDWWADHVSLSFYGENLRQIVKTNNAWFIASPSGSSVIRLFGSFTDPHSFALYILLALPFVISISVFAFKQKFNKKWFWWVLCLFFIILSGTRGIWFGIIAAFLAGIYLLIKKMNQNRVVSSIVVVLIIFVALVPIVSVFTTIPQFNEHGTQDSSLILKRLISVLNLDETSNQGRIYIWKKSLESFKQYPFLGVGTGNFPIILEQDIALAKAGSSAHNLYLNFLAENGIFALILIGLIFWESLIALIVILKSNLSWQNRLLFSGLFMFLFWTFAYCFFDIALLDERVFLLFLTVLGLIFAVKKNPRILENE